MIYSKTVFRPLKIFLFLLFISSVLFYTIYSSYYKIYLPFIFKGHLNNSAEYFDYEEKEIKIPKGYIIYNGGCKIQDFDPFDTSILEILPDIDEILNFNCEYKTPLVVATTDFTFLKVNYTALRAYYGGILNYCSYSPIYRDLEGSSDDGFQYGITQRFEDKILIEHEFVKVKCYNTDEISIYENFYPFIIKKPKVEKRCKDKILQSKQQSSVNSLEHLNVNVIGIDSISRLNFIRYCPDTYSFLLDEMKGFELKGYNKVADNTFVNLVPMLTGKYIEELPWDASLSDFPFDQYSFIWTNYSDEGYRTLFAEDLPQISTFNYLKSGFFYSPTDYYLRPFYMAYENSKLYETSNSFCLGSTLHTNVILNWIYQFSKTFHSNPYFSFSFISSLTHDHLETVSIADKHYKDFFKTLMDEQLLNNTILFIISDHGIRFGEFRRTYIGRLEERLPLAMVIVPPRFYHQYPDIIKTLKRNTMRLTTPFDIYKTFKDILYFSGKQALNILPNSRAISLFNDIPENRTCEDTTVMPHWCTCQEKIPKQTDDYIVEHSARFIVTKINDIIFNYRNVCVELTLKEIKNAWATQSNENILKFEQSVGDGAAAKVSYGDRTKSMTDIIIVLTTLPNNAEFEATVRHDEQLGVFDLMGDISRLNKYNNESWCIKNYAKKLYCYCKDFLDKK